MKQSIQKVEQLEMLGYCVAFRPVSMVVDVEGMEFSAEEIVYGKAGIVGVRGGYPQMDVRKDEDSAGLHEIVAIGPKAKELTGLSPGDYVVFSALVRLFTPLMVGTEELKLSYIDEASVLARVHPPEFTEEEKQKIIKLVRPEEE